MTFRPNLSAQGIRTSCDIIAPKKVIVSKMPSVPIGITPGATVLFIKNGSS
jgi:hypothetical protein